jgi:hypothetical protein
VGRRPARGQVIDLDGGAVLLLVVIVSMVITLAIVARFGLANILWTIARILWFFILFIFVFIGVVFAVALLF